MSVLSRRASGMTSSATTCCGRRPENRSKKRGWKEWKSRRRLAFVTEGRPPEENSWLSGLMPFCCLLPWLSGRWSWCLVLLSGPPVGSGRLALSSAFVFLACFSLFSKRATTQEPIFQPGISSRQWYRCVICYGRDTLLWLGRLSFIFSSVFSSLR